MRAVGGCGPAGLPKLLVAVRPKAILERGAALRDRFKLEIMKDSSALCHGYPSQLEAG